jgi:long-subunit acyl-CoA synthetase (AMP-forming)
LKIIDRKKHIFKLSQGEYIAPEKIENVYSKSQYVAQVFVHGEGLKSCVIAIVVPDVENVKYYAAEHNIPGTLSVLCNTPEIKQLIMNDITDLGKKAGLKSFEQVRTGFVPLTVEKNDEMRKRRKSSRQAGQWSTFGMPRRCSLTSMVACTLAKKQSSLSSNRF